MLKLDFKDITKHLQADLKRFSPFGPCNQKPIFCTNRVYDYGTSKVVGREQEHIKLELVDSKLSTVLNGIAFGQSAAARHIKSKRSFDIAFTIEENIFKKNQVQLQIEDIRPNEDEVFSPTHGLGTVITRDHTVREQIRQDAKASKSAREKFQKMADKYQEILRTYWGYPDFRGIQRDIIESIARGEDTLGLMPTGGGKSITFQVPALAQKGVCIVGNSTHCADEGSGTASQGPQHPGGSHLHRIVAPRDSPYIGKLYFR